MIIKDAALGKLPFYYTNINEESRIGTYNSAYIYKCGENEGYYSIMLYSKTNQLYCMLTAFDEFEYISRFSTGSKCVTLYNELNEKYTLCINSKVCFTRYDSSHRICAYVIMGRVLIRLQINYRSNIPANFDSCTFDPNI